MSEMMLQQVMTQPKSIEYQKVAIPKVREGEVCIKIMRMAICGSDIHVYHGQHPYVTYPLTQGHEISGEIVAIGQGVEGLLVGQKVTIEPQVYCGECHPCTHGKYNLCEKLKVIGFQTIGAASQFFILDAKKVDILPDSITYDEGAMIEPLSVAVHACKKIGNIKDKKIIVLGAGPIGNLVAQTAKALGAHTVMITDISDYRLNLAKTCGIDVILNTQKQDFAQEILHIFGQDKADFIFDCAGNNITINQAIQNARKGSTIILVAVFAGLATVDLAKLNDSELELNTSMMYRHEDFKTAIELVAQNKIMLKPLITKNFAFTDFKLAYEHIDNNREHIMKVFININE